MYDHPDINLKEVKQILDKFLKVLQNRAIRGFVLALIILLSIAFGVKIYFPQYFDSQIKSFLAPIEIRLEKLKNEELVKNQDLSKQADLYTSPISYEQAIIDSVKQASPSVVSIIISKNMPVYEQYFTDPFEGFASPFF